MKKIALYMSLALAGLFTTACNEEFGDWASPQTNSPENAITIPGFTASAVAPQNLATTGEEVPLFTLSNPGLPDGYVLGNARVELTPKDVEEPSTIILNTTIEGMGPKEFLQELTVNTYGKRPDVRTYDARVLVNAIKDGQAVFIDAGNTEVKIIPEAPHIAQNYYIVGGSKNWDSSKEQKFTHSDKDVYDDPVFTIVIDASEGGDTWFAIGDDEGVEAIGDGEWNKLLGIVGGDNKATEGSLDYRYNMGADNSFCVPAGAKKIKVTIDMMEYTFKVETINIADAYYLIGGPGEWNNSKAQKFSHSDKDVFEDPVFTYVFEGSGSDMWFAFGDEEAIDAVGDNVWNKLFGTTGASEDLSGTFERRYNLDGDHSFHVDGKAKYYRFSVNMMLNTYEIAPLNFSRFVYFIGATDGWKNAEQKLESPANDGIYTGYIYCADPNNWGNEFKFQRVAGSWDDEINSATFTGGITGDFSTVDGNTNIAAKAGEGVYYVTLNLAAGTLNAVRITNMNLVGDFNGWNPADDAQQMRWNAEEYCFEITGAGVNANGWKFTANNDWAINLGGDTLTELVANGPNITATGATIKLYPTRRTSDAIFCTIE